MPKVSVIVPVYNTGKYLDETFQCLVNQSLKEIEILVVNDGSTDDSEHIIRKYQEQDDRIICFSQANQGQSAARNLAMKHAMGEYIYFMDSDDMIDTDALRLCYDYARRTEADFIFFDGETMLDEGATPIGWDYKRTYLLEEGRRYSGEYLLNMMLDHGKHSCVVWLLFIRKAYLDHIGLTFYDGIIHEDELYTTVLTLRSNNIYGMQRSLVKHRIRKASTMGKHYSKRNIDCYLTVTDELLRFQQSPLIDKFCKYTLSKVFYTGHVIPQKDKFSVFWRAWRSGYLKYIGMKPTLVFWLKK